MGSLQETSGKDFFFFTFEKEVRERDGPSSPYSLFYLVVTSVTAVFILATSLKVMIPFCKGGQSQDNCIH